jgi:hypothetical protein
MGNDEEESQRVAKAPHHHKLPRHRPSWRTKVETSSTTSHRSTSSSPPSSHALEIERRCSKENPRWRSHRATSNLLLNRRSTPSHPESRRKSLYLHGGVGEWTGRRKRWNSAVSGQRGGAGEQLGKAWWPARRGRGRGAGHQRGGAGVGEGDDT